jgi:hypothetical protein
VVESRGSFRDRIDAEAGIVWAYARNHLGCG